MARQGTRSFQAMLTSTVDFTPGYWRLLGAS